MRVQEHTAYRKARKLALLAWGVHNRWDRDAKSTLGNQLVRSVDSISANLAEGWSRYSKKDKINFYIIARGSTGETIDWVEKAFERNLIDSLELTKMIALLEDLPKDINGLIKGTKDYLKK